MLKISTTNFKNDEIKILNIIFLLKFQNIILSLKNKKKNDGKK